MTTPPKSGRGDMTWLAAHLHALCREVAARVVYDSGDLPAWDELSDGQRGWWVQASRAVYLAAVGDERLRRRTLPPVKGGMPD